MKLAIKMISAFLAIGILIGIAGYLGYSQVSSIASAFSKVESNDIPALWALGEIESAILRIELEPLEYIVKPDPSTPQSWRRQRREFWPRLQCTVKVGVRKRQAGWQKR